MMHVMMRRRLVTILLTALPTVALAGCGPSGDGTGPSPGFELAVGSPSLTVSVGSAVVNAVTVTRAEGFEGAVTVTIDGLPAGVVAAPVTIAPGATSAAFTLTATGSAAIGTSDATVRAVAAGAVARSTTVQVTVKLAPAFSLALAAPTVAIEPRFSGTATVTIDRQGDFDGAVNLNASGAPFGMSISFAPSSPGSTSTTISIAVASRVPVGVYPVTITGTGNGVLPKSIVLTVTVTPAVTPAIEIDAAPAAILITEVVGRTINIDITRVNFDGVVGFEALDVPHGLQVSFAPTTAGAVSTTMTLTPTTVTPGDYVLTVQATAAGVAAAQREVTVSVAALPPTLRLAASPASLSVARNGSGTARLMITRTNAPGETQFSLLGLPRDVIATFSPERTKGDTASVILSVGPDAPPGTYPLVIHSLQVNTPNVFASAPLVLIVPGGPAPR